MMETPIYDFIKKYAESESSRFHMPGHKGRGPLGFEKYDITEISGADALYEASGIIAQSEKNAADIFRTGKTLYTTEGSSHAICAMLFLAYTGAKGKSRTVLAARNVHKAFIHACALIGCDADFIYPQKNDSVCSCSISPEDIDKKLCEYENPPFAFYITSPDYLGNISDIQKISQVCKKHNVPLLVDNAHGAYLAFLKNNIHPIALGAYVCCDSAHKTLPVLTGGAYLHLSEQAKDDIGNEAKSALSLFGSTSPSYLTLSSLDLCNAYLCDAYEKKLNKTVLRINKIKKSAAESGLAVLTGEPLKVTIHASRSGYTGYELAGMIKKAGGIAEFYDDDFLVCMLTPENSAKDFDLLEDVLTQIKPKDTKITPVFSLAEQKRALSIREAVFSPKERVEVSSSAGRICAESAVSCPPAVPIAVCGEIISNEQISLFKKYGIEYISVVK